MDGLASKKCNGTMEECVWGMGYWQGCPPSELPATEALTPPRRRGAAGGKNYRAPQAVYSQSFRCGRWLLPKHVHFYGRVAAEASFSGSLLLAHFYM